MEYMATLKDNEFDLAIVDPPYGLNIDGQKLNNTNRNPKHNRKYHEKRGWDNAIPNKSYFIELNRVSKNQIIWGANYFVEHLKPSKGWIFWYKGQTGLTMSDGEIAYSSFNKVTRAVTLNRGELAREGTIHPTQKPIKLYKRLLTDYAEKGQRILDTHLGSGSSAIAAHYYGCDFVGCELDKHYYDLALERFNEVTRQMALL